MDPRAFTRKGYDTDLLILRTLFALNPNTNLPISSFYVATTDGIGGLYWLSAVDYISAATGINNLPSTIRTLSTNLSTATANLSNLSSFVSTAVIQGLSSLSTAIGNGSLPGSITALQLNSTIIGAGTVGYISTLSLQSTLRGLGTISYVSSSQLASTVTGLGTASYISSSALAAYTASSFTSTISWITDPIRYISTGNLLSTSINFISRFENLNFGTNISSVVVYGTLNQSNVSIGVQNIYIQDVSTLSTAVGVQLNTLSTALYGNQLGFITSTNLFSSLAGLGTLQYISTSALTSTVQGLGSAGFVNSLSLTSSIQGLGTVNYISSLSLLSSFSGLGTLGYISSIGATQGVLTSTVIGLGTSEYLSSLSLLSTVTGLGSAGYISSVGATQTALTSSVIGLGSAEYISTATLNSTLTGLASLRYISSTQFLSSFSNILSASNYISTGNLQSTSVGLLNSFTIVNAGNIFITNGGSLTVTNANGNIVYLSSFLYSSITYSGENGTLRPQVSLPPTSFNSNIFFSTANLQFDVFSSFITNRSIITIDTFPSVFFTQLAYTNFNTNPLTPINISSFIQYGGNNFLSSQMSQTMFYPSLSATGSSNLFNSPIRITVPGSLICNVYSQRPFRLSHFLPNAISVGTSNGLSNSNATCYFASTNSLFLSIQNLPP